MELATPDPITEEWIRKKLNITTDSLEDIKSLSLPGSYQEKITHLGDGLYKFSRLKELDLSRNSLVSLDGLENLKYLEKLNLYFNQISSLKEIEKLKYNKNLIELDLRLNPITKEEADYRLYLINILPSLQICDDREIKDAERKMALSYYEQKNQIKKQASFELFQNSNNQTTSSRVKSISNIVKRSAGINEPSTNNEDAIVQNFLTYHMNENDYDHNRPRSNQNTKQTFEQYSPKSLKELGDRENREIQRKNSASYNFNKHRSTSLQELTNRNEEDRNLQFADETEAYSAYKSRAAFTPNPQYEPESNDFEKHQSNNKNNNKYNKEDEEVNMILADQKNNPIFNLLDLVDRYWNGTKSLHKNFKFLGLANQLLTQYSKYTNEHNPLESQVNLLQNQLKNSQEENRKLQQQLIQIKQNKDQERLDSDAHSKNYVTEIDNLKKKLIIYQEENKRLRKECADKTEKFSYDNSINSMESENENLKKDVEVMKLKLKQYEQLQQLTAMLQESHKSLVTTNEHLLREINDQKSSLNSSLPLQNRLKADNSFDLDDLDYLNYEPTNQVLSSATTNTHQSRQKTPVRKSYDLFSSNSNNRLLYTTSTK